MRRAPVSLLLLFAVAPAGAQTVRATGSTSARYITVRELVVDSVAASTTRGEGVLRRAQDGTIVRCVTGETFCRYTRSGRTLSTAPFVQDLTLSAWGFARGVRAFAQVRGRAGLGAEDELWPRADDPFDVLVAYIELDRPRFRIRAGRQWKVSGLGYYNWDGASALLRATPAVQVEIFGGWSLARGLDEPLTGDALEAVEAFAPDVRALLVGVQAGWRPTPLAALALLYQRELRDDGKALYSERFAVDASLRRGRARVEGALEVDVALRDVNDARLRAGLALPRDLGAELFVRHYRPYFDLWTIWGAFDPVGFTEIGSTLAWRPSGVPVSISADLARRAYPDAGAATTFGAARSAGWRFGGAATLRPDTAWLALLSYHVDAGFGAGRNDLAVLVRRDLGQDHYIGTRVLLFERAFEFRVGDGRVLGAGLDAGARLGPRMRATASAAVYRHLAGSGAPAVDWSQVRGSLRFDWVLGSEPGMPGRRAGAR